MSLISKIKKTIFRTPQIHLAVVGPSASGKSYLITDMIQALNNMDMVRHTLSGYRDFGLYESDVTTSDRLNPRPKTDRYACRAENHYGAEFEHEGTRFELDFLNIPGEIFNPKSTDLTEFFRIRQMLIERCRRRFAVVTWTDGFNDELYIEPRGISAEASAALATAQREGNLKATAKERQQDYCTWEQIYAEINANGRRLTRKGDPKVVDGGYILEHLRDFNTDSAMRSIAEVVATLGIGIDAYDFMARLSVSFYFFCYCCTATDMIICDRMVLPTSADDSPRSASFLSDAEIEFVPLVNQLVAFFTAKGKQAPHIYLAYRGADYFVKGKEENWRRILSQDVIRSMTDQQRRNSVYAIASLLIHNHRFPASLAHLSPQEFNELTGLNVENWGNGETPVVDFLSQRLIDFAPEGGSITTGGTIADLFRSHQGQNMETLMRQSYKSSCVIAPGALLAGMMRHVYYTATPISDNFYVFSNDPNCNYQCFSRDDFQGHTRYFHNYNSHLCFGTYQLCLDILFQHDVIPTIDGGDLYVNLTS